MRRSAKRANAALNASVLKSEENSRCLAFVIKHMKTQTNAFEYDARRSADVFTRKGSAKSTPVAWKGSEYVVPTT